MKKIALLAKVSGKLKAAGLTAPFKITKMAMSDEDGNETAKELDERLFNEDMEAMERNERELKNECEKCKDLVKDYLLKNLSDTEEGLDLSVGKIMETARCLEKDTLIQKSLDLVEMTIEDSVMLESLNSQDIHGSQDKLEGGGAISFLLKGNDLTAMLLNVGNV